LPKDKEEIDPKFDYYQSTEIPTWKEGDLTFKLVAGNAFGKSAPLQGYSPLFMVDIQAKKATTINLKGQLKGEVAFVIVKGSITDQGETVEAGQMLISKTNEACEICVEEGTQLLLFGGEPLAEEHFLLWNFVSHSKERLQEAKKDWEDKEFPMVPEDTTYIPMPKPKLK
jgi:redox-sensitive bicupin YhaK (pirin superfamily)